jgi:hypothetical protein
MIELIKKYKKLSKERKSIIWMRVGLTIIASILIFGPFLMYNMNGHRKLTCPTKYVDKCISMYEKNQGTVKKILSFKNDVVVFLVEDKEDKE